MTTAKGLFPALSNKDRKTTWGGLEGCTMAMAISEAAKRHSGPCLVITESIHQADTLAEEIQFFSNGEIPVEILPDWEILAYDHFSPHQDIISSRLDLLSRLPQISRGVVLASISTLLHWLPPADRLLSQAFSIRVQDTLSLEEFRNRLVLQGYRHVGVVMEHGEFTVRGAILDFFPMGANTPFRLEFFDDEIESMRSFDPESQRTLDKTDSLRLLPAHEYPLDPENITRFRQAWREHFSGNPLECPIYLSISEGRAAPGVEYYLSLFYTKLSPFSDYLPTNTQVIVAGNIESSLDRFNTEVSERYEQLRYDRLKPLCEPSQVLLSKEQFYASLKAYNQLKLQADITDSAHYVFKTSALPNLSAEPRHTPVLYRLQHYAQQQGEGKRLLFVVESAGRRELLLEQLRLIDLSPYQYNDWPAALSESHPLGLVIGPIEQGLYLPSLSLAIITEAELFAQRVGRSRDKRAKSLDPAVMIRNLTELNIGAPVVHLNHGVGRYLGLQTIKTGDIEAEYLTLEYADSDKIYVPVASLHLISRYTGADSDHAPLQKLGNKQWERQKHKTAEQIRDAAAELLDIYGRRQAAQGFAFKLDQAEYQLFADGFKFDETPDQQQAINQVINDMCSPRVMDRLVCGDVGFGKTEVAMRAAFVAVQNGKQVAILVPTTLLVNQHLQNFQDRFAEWPVKIAGLSRLHGGAEAKKILDGVAEGKIDIVIGTHKLLSSEVKFKDLGLLIIDEEQRFGVHQKERITSLRAQIDILTLTATPIPRTLNMALAGTRDLSIIATPPLRRLSVKTFVHEFSPGLVREAILREVLRGGQVYYLHNDVATMQAFAEKIKTIVPEAKIKIAHGQMREKELERVMSEFYHQQFNVLLCSTIVESGIDIPSANTIIIDRADKFGLAQLHQLRGRVGRSHHQAYAYLITPPEKALTKDAQKRMAAIAELGDLGVGFSLATYDLEIRGAGELLGDEQSGHIHAIGFSLYMELLEEAVKALKAGVEPNFDKPLQAGVEIDLGISALLPTQYIGDVSVRLTLYKRLANCSSEDEIQQFKAELIDRFGMIPVAAQNLLDVTKLRLLATQLGITKIEMGEQQGYIQFAERPSINLEKLIELIQKQSKHYQLQGTSRLRFQASAAPGLSKVALVTQVLKHLH